MSSISEYVERYQTQILDEQDKRNRVEKESKEKAEKYEYEVQLRLQFEAKLNSMHSMHRTLETQLVQAKNDRFLAVEQLDHYKEQATLYMKQFNQIRIDKEEIDQKHKFDLEKIATMQEEISMLKETLLEYESKLNLRRQSTMNLNSDNIQNAISELKNKTFDPQIHEINVKLIEDSKNLSHEQIEIYENRYRELSELYVKTLDELNVYKSEKIGNEEILNERNSRIDRLKKELETIKRKQSLFYYLFV